MITGNPKTNPMLKIFVPIIFPLIAGAGTLTTLLSMRAEYHLENIIVAVVLNMILVFVVLKKFLAEVSFMS